MTGAEDRCGTPIGIEDVLITGQLALRPSRAPDHAAENHAFIALARQMATHPDGVLQACAGLAMELCGADSAAISVLEGDAADCVFRWRATAGALASKRGVTLPKDLSPCGIVLERDAVLLFSRPERHFAALAEVEPRIHECLLVPWHVGGVAVGTVWAINHRSDAMFDAEDVRLLKSLAGFASAAHQVTHATADRDRLRMSEARHRTALVAAERRAAELAAVLESMPDAVYIGGLEGITIANAHALDQLGFTTREELNRHVGALAAEIQTRDARTGAFIPVERQAFTRALGGERVVQDVRVRHRLTGEDRVVRCAAAPVLIDGRVIAAVAVNSDVTEARRVEEELRESEARQRVRVELGDRLRALVRISEIQADVTRMLGNHLGASRVQYAEIEPDDEHAVVPDDYASAAPSRAGRYRLADFEALTAECRLGRTFIAGDLATDRRLGQPERGIYAALPVAAMVVVPLLKDARLAALLAVHRAVPCTWSTGEIALIEEAAERTWAAIERARAEKALRASEARLAADLAGMRRLYELHSRLAGEADLGTALDEILAAATALTGAEYGTVQLVAADGEHLEMVAHRGFAPGARFIEYFSHGGSRIGCDMVRLQRRRVIWKDVEAAPELVGTGDLEVARADGIRATQSTPILSRTGDLVGVLSTQFKRPHCPGEDELRRIDLLAWAAGDFIVRHRTEAALRELNETLERRVDDALAQRKVFADLFETTDALIQIIDFDYNFVAINKAHRDEYERLYGVRPEIGDNMLDLLAGSPQQREAVRAVWARALAGEALNLVAEFGDPARATGWYDLKFSPLRSLSGVIIGACVFGYEVSERRREQERLAEAEEALRQSQKLEAMGQLTGGVAHDLNNLLMPILGNLDLLRRRGFGGERERRMIEGALTAADRAKSLVHRLLAFARRQPLQPAAVDVGALVVGMAELINSTSGPRVRVELDVAADLPPARGDTNQLEMAVLNLAVNARDAMPDGGTLTIAARAETVGSGHRANLAPGEYVRLSVADTGIGMTPEILARAVEPFYSTKGIGRGTGLGLSMVHGLAAQLGGTLLLASKPGLGTVATLWLPVSRGAASVPASRDQGESRSGAGTALLVDDEDLARASTADMLAEMGYAVIEAACGEDALRLVEDGLSPDLLVTDHLMPGMTGTALTRAVRGRLPGLPVLVVSGYAEADGIAPDLPRLPKPFRHSELEAAVARLKTPG